MLLCLWERLVSAVIMWSCWVCTLAQCLCILDTIYHSVLRIARNKSTPPRAAKKKQLSRTRTFLVHVNVQ